MVSFNQVPSAIRVPLAYVEFDNTEASSGSSIQPYRLLLLGQKLSAGSATPNIPIRVSSENQANTYFGQASMLAKMAKKAIAANNFTEMWAIPFEDVVAGVAATSTMVVTGTATKDGTLSLFIGGELVSVPVLEADTASDVATAIQTAIAAVTSLPVTASVPGGSPTNVLLTFKHKGLFGNDFPVVLNYYDEDQPIGISVTTPAFTGGTTNPDIQDGLDNLGDEAFRTIVMPYLDTANLTAIEGYLSEKWGPLYSNDGHAFTVTRSASATAATLGLSRNSPHLTIMENVAGPMPTYEAAAILGATVAYYSPIDPARTLQTLELVGLMPPKSIDRLILSERNVLLYSGIATTSVDSGGKVRIERLITTYKEAPNGSPDESYLDYETLATLSYLRYDFKAFFQRKYPRHKLAKDGTRFQAGQAIITPKDAKVEVIGLFGQWEALGLVENAAQFAEQVIVEISATNPNRLDFYLPPDLINNLRILAAKIAFRL